MKDNEDAWKKFYQSVNPSIDECPIKFDCFKILPLLKCVRPDLLLATVSALVEGILARSKQQKPKTSNCFYLGNLGADFTNPPLFNLPASFSNSSCKNPLIFIHPASFDPTLTLLKFAADMVCFRLISGDTSKLIFNFRG